MLMDSIQFLSGADWNYDLAGSTLSTPSDGDVITRFTAVRAFDIPANMDGTKITVGTNPTSSSTLKIWKNGVDTGTLVATITINSSGVETLPTQSAVSYAVDDIFEIEVDTADSIDELGISIKTVAP